MRTQAAECQRWVICIPLRSAVRQLSVAAALIVLRRFMWSLAKRKHATVAVAEDPLLWKMGARADFDDVYVCYAFIAL